MKKLSLSQHYIWDSELKFFNNRISQKDFEIYDFYDFEETFRSECSERNEWRKRLCKIKKHQRYQKGFLWYHQIKKVNDRDIIWYANLAHFSMIMLSELRRISGVNFCSFDWFRSSLLICSKVQPYLLLSDM